MSTPFVRYHRDDVETYPTLQSRRREDCDGYQPPPPIDRSSGKDSNDHTCTTSTTDYLTNDHAFFQFGSYLLSIVDGYSHDSLISNPEIASEVECQRKSIEKNLQKSQAAISLSDIKAFNSALEIRFRSLPMNPEPDESQFTTMVRRCNRLLKQPLHRFMTERSRHVLSDQTQRRNESRYDVIPSQGFHMNSTKQEPSRENKENEIIYTFNPSVCPSEVDDKNGRDAVLVEDVPHSKDLTKHIVWDISLNDRNLQLQDMHNQKPDVDNQHQNTNHVRNLTSQREGDVDQQVFDDNFVRIVAPESLPEGFTFEARVSDETFLATVPEGGVLKGQVFSSPKVALDHNHQLRGRTKRFVDMQAPMGRWRDGIFDFLKHGICHPMFLNSFFCPQFTLSQILARFQLNMAGERPENMVQRTRLKEVQLLTSLMVAIHGIFIFLVVRSFFMYYPIKYVIIGFSPVFFMDLLLIVYFFHLVIKVRKLIRKNYKIPEGCCYGCEDIFVSLLLAPCTLAQIGRHTSDYGTYIGLCCTDTGLPPHVESRHPRKGSDLV